MSLGLLLLPMSALSTSGRYLTLPYLTGKACYRLALRPPVGPMRIPELTVRLLKPLGVLANFKSELQCSCLISLENKRWFPNCFLLFSARALHLPRRCRLVSYSSPQRGHIGSSSVFSKIKCRLSELSGRYFSALLTCALIITNISRSTQPSIPPGSVNEY